MQENFNPKTVKLIIGLGNPKKEYENTYHNAGFLFIDYLERKPAISNLQFSIFKSSVFMNESGLFVYKKLKDKKIKPETLLIIHDDSDLNLGGYKIYFDGGSAGHKGIESITNTIGTRDFWRLKIGIRRVESLAGLRRAKAEEFVLKNITPRDRKTLENVFEKITNTILAEMAYHNGS